MREWRRGDAKTGGWGRTGDGGRGDAGAGTRDGGRGTRGLGDARRGGGTRRRGGGTGDGGRGDAGRGDAYRSTFSCSDLQISASRHCFISVPVLRHLFRSPSPIPISASPSPISPSPLPAPRPVSPSPIPPHRFSFFDERIDAFLSVTGLHEFVEIDVFDFLQRCLDGPSVSQSVPFASFPTQSRKLAQFGKHFIGLLFQLIARYQMIHQTDAGGLSSVY